MAASRFASDCSDDSSFRRWLRMRVSRPSASFTLQLVGSVLETVRGRVQLDRALAQRRLVGREVCLPAALEALAQLDEAGALLLRVLAVVVGLGERLVGLLVPRRELPFLVGFL